MQPCRQTPSRWKTLVAAMGLELCGGSTYISNLYLDQLANLYYPNDKARQSKMDMLLFATNLGTWLPLAGFLFDWRHGGPRRVALLGCLLYCLGFGGIYLTTIRGEHPAEQTTPPPPFALLFALFFLWGHGVGYFDGAAISCTAINFPELRGTAVGLAKAFFGLSGSLLTQFYMAFFVSPTDPAPFLLFLALGLPGLGAICAPFLHIGIGGPATAELPATTSRRFAEGYAIVLSLAFAMCAFGVLRSFTAWGATRTAAYVATGLIGVAACALLRLGRASAGGGDNSDYVRAELLREGNAELPVVPRLQLPEETPKLGHATDMTARQSLCTVEFWLLAAVLFSGLGGGLVILNHVQGITDAQLADPATGGSSAAAKHVSDVLVSLLSIFNCLGRVAAGIGSDRWAIVAPRPLWLAAACALMGSAHILLLRADLIFCLYAAICIGGFAYGAVWSLLPATVADLFGVGSFASILSMCAPIISVASLLLSTLVVSAVYEAGARHQPAGTPAGVCYGDACFAGTHIVVACCCAASLLCALGLGRRSNSGRSLFERRQLLGALS